MLLRRILHLAYCQATSRLILWNERLTGQHKICPRDREEQGTPKAARGWQMARPEACLGKRPCSFAVPTREVHVPGAGG
jgi:hypothetical protein